MGEAPLYSERDYCIPERPLSSEAQRETFIYQPGRERGLLLSIAAPTSLLWAKAGVDRLRVAWLNGLGGGGHESRRFSGDTTQSHISPSILVYEDTLCPSPERHVHDPGRLAPGIKTGAVQGYLAHKKSPHLRTLQ